MLIFLIEFFGQTWTVPTVFTYVSTRMALASATSLILTIGLGRPLIRTLYAWKIGERVRQEHCPLLGELHRNKTDTPTMGGVLILFALLISLILYMDLRSSFTLLLLLATVVNGALGSYDDYLKLRYQNKKGLSGRKKLLVQVLFATFVALYLLNPSMTERFHRGKWFKPPQAKEMVREEVAGPQSVTALALLSTKEFASRIYLPFVKAPLFQLSGVAALVMGLLMIVVITGTSNAVNLTDGLDGLATGTVLFAAAAFALIAFVMNNLDLARYLHILYIDGSGEIAVFLSALVGACLGFLWYNSHPAQVFMGDTGALPLGSILGLTAVLLKREFLLFLVGGVFVAEALSVMLQVGSYRLRNKKRVFLCAPLHHHFEYKGWAETKVVSRFWIIGFLLAVVGLASLKFQ